VKGNNGMFYVENYGHKKIRITIDDIVITMSESDGNELLECLDEHFNFGETRNDLISKIECYKETYE
jgi:hypothetical protein